MTRSVLADAFDHHCWATLVVLDQLSRLSDEQLATTIPGTYGTILDTARHLVGADRWYLYTLTSGTVDEIEERTMDIAGLRAAMEPDADHWRAVLGTNPDPDEQFVLRETEGESHATWGVRLAQAIHHGTDHRSQLCTGLTALGIEPPGIDVWDWALTQGKHWYIEAPVPAG
jgi:uncharacterized damage-inducible protein DinB